MSEWTVSITARAPAEVTEPLEPDDPRIERLVDLLHGLDGVVQVRVHEWTALVTVAADDPSVAWKQALTAVVAAGKEAGLPFWPQTRFEIVRGDVADEDHGYSNFPAIVGSSEVLGLMGVSRQRLSELRSGGRFPAPIVELASGPVWLRSTVEAYLGSWDRRPGRPKSRGGV